jgi:hypothetical protein
MKEAKLMGRLRSNAAAVACAAVLLTPAIAAAQGPPADRTTYVTFSGDVSVPGATLPAGTYTFRIADSPANRHIVQILDREGSKVFATLLAVPAERNEATGEPVITFKETPSDRPPAVRYWYYAGEKDGNELVYPRAQALMIARASGQPVMSVDSDATDIEGWKKGNVSAITGEAAQGQTSSALTTTPSATTSTGSPTSDTTTSASTTSAPTSTQPTTSQPVTTAPTTTAEQPPAQTTPAPAATAPVITPTPEPTPSAAPVQSQTPDQPVGTSGRSDAAALPRTASERPMIAFLGFLALLGAGAVRVARRSVA